MSQPGLLRELWEMIIDNLHDDRRTLATCALVCRTWVPSSRSRQFRTLILPPNPHSRGQKFLLISDPSSTVPPYVRHLAIGEGRGLARRSDPGAFWVEQALPRIRADDLVALNFLELYGVDLARLSPESVRQLHSLCQRPRVVALDAFGRNSVVPLLQLLQMCRSVETFYASGRYEDESQLTVVVPGSFTLPPHLHTIELRSSYSFMAALYHCECTGLAVHTVRIHDVDCDQAPYAVRFLDWCGPTVEQVTLDLIDPRFRQPEEEPAEVDFCAAGGLVNNTGIHVLNLTGSPAHLPLMLKQVRSPFVERVGFNTTPSAVNSFDPNALHALFSRPPFASAQFRVVASGAYVQPLIEMRDKVFTMFNDLRAQGRLEFERVGGYSMDPATPPIDHAEWASPFPCISPATAT